MRLRFRLLTGVGSVLLGSAAATAQNCQPIVPDASFSPSIPGWVWGMAAFDDGSGNGQRFYVSGTLPTFGNAAVLTEGAGGWGWQQVGGGLAGIVPTLDVLPDGQGPGGGPSLYAGGAAGIFRLVNGAWQAATPPVPLAAGNAVYSVQWFDDGSGGAIHCLTGGAPVDGGVMRFLKRQDGTWRTLGTFTTQGNSRVIQRVFVYDEDGPGPRPMALYIVGSVQNVTAADGTLVSASSSGMVRWDGTSFTVLPAAVYSPWIKAAVLYDDGSGAGRQLYISGHSGVRPIGKWDGALQRWVDVGPTHPSGVDAMYGMTVVPDGLGSSGGRIYGATTYLPLLPAPNYTVAWNGQQWSGVFGAPYINVGSLYYHLPSAGGTVGRSVPGLLTAQYRDATSTAFFAVATCPRCSADSNLDGVLTVNDILTYLSWWFAGRASADFNHTGGLTVQDVFDYLGAWFGGC